MDGITGYLSGTDKPLKNAVIRSAGSWNYISYSNDDGHYAIFATIFQNVPGYPDRSWGLTAINPFTMYRYTSDLMIYNSAGCTNACNVINNFNIMLGNKNTVIPDTTAPSISVDMSVVPGQAIAGMTSSPQIVAGTVPVGTDIQFTIKAVDQQMSTATLEAAYTSVDGLSKQQYAVQLSEVSHKVNSQVDTYGAPLYIWEYTYQPAFNVPIAGSLSQYFKPDKPGTYTFTIYATDAAGNKSNKTISVSAVAAGAMPGSYDGPPTVTQIIPMNNAVGVMVSAPVKAYFSEPVKVETLKDNFYLQDTNGTYLLILKSQMLLNKNNIHRLEPALSPSRSHHAGH